MTTFTASEVRELAKHMESVGWRPDSKGDPECYDEGAARSAEILFAFADLLEAREKAVPVKLEYYDAGLLNNFGGGNIDWWWDYIRNELGRAHSFYQSQFDGIMSAPSDAERLAEALRDDEGHEWPASLNIRDTKLHDDLGGPGQRIYTTAGRGYKTMKYIRHDIANSAQAQPPAASVTDAMKRAFEHLASIGYPKNARGNYDKDGEWTFSDAVPRDVDAREVSAAFHALKTALAAQESPNG